MLHHSKIDTSLRRNFHWTAFTAEPPFLLLLLLRKDSVKAIDQNEDDRARELCESRGGRPGFLVPNSPYGLCGREATLNLNSKKSTHLEAGISRRSKQSRVDTDFCISPRKSETRRVISWILTSRKLHRVTSAGRIIRYSKFLCTMYQLVQNTSHYITSLSNSLLQRK